MTSEYQRVALGARMVHFTTLFVGAFAFFPLWDWVLRQRLPAHAIPASLTFGYALSLLIVSFSSAAFLAQLVEHGHMHMEKRRRSHEEMPLFSERVQQEYALLARCVWYRYALRTGCLSTLAAMYAFAVTRNMWCSLYISLVGVCGCLAIIRTR